MNTKIQDQVVGLADSLLAYLPNFIGGMVLILIGWLAGWIVKRLLVQFSIILRIDRYLKRTRFEAELSKADVRYSLYNLIGNIGFTLIFLIFIDNALLAWKLDILSDLLSKGILFLPKVITAVVIFGIGWLLASWVQISILKSLHREEIPRASLISRFIKSILLIFFSAISLVELDVAREIIIIGFSTIFVTLGIVTVVVTAVGSKSFLKKLEDSFSKEINDIQE
jgi:Mechanosensitive ion channel, conserved TM helix